MFAPDRDERRKPNLGPHGVGNPDDKSLRHTEKEVLITQIKRRIVRDEYCNKEIEDYNACCQKYGIFSSPFKCKNIKITLSDCLETWNDNEDVYKRAKDEYLDERSQYRRTGLSKEQREEISKYIAEKKKTEKKQEQIS